MRRLILAVLAFAGALCVALAHSWYPIECCSEKDCFPVPVERVKTAPGGWVLEDGTFIAFRDARPSPDGRYHLCRYNDGAGALITVPGKPTCFWAPMGAS